MSVHEQFAEDLALYALEVLQGDERAALEKHLEDCPSCRRELQQFRGDMALMALSTAGPMPPRRSRDRLLHALAREPRQAPDRRGWWALVPWFVAAALAMALVALGLQNLALKQRIVGMQNESAEQLAELQRAREVDAMRVTLVVAKTPPQPQGKAIYVRDQSSLIFLASNFQPLPPQKAYELWLIPTQGAPIPAGVFKPDKHGSATVIDPPLPENVEAKAFAITIEPESGSSAPTMPILMIGAGE
jgi:anti-sigma-K factor RskA